MGLSVWMMMKLIEGVMRIFVFLLIESLYPVRETPRVAIVSSVTEGT